MSAFNCPLCDHPNPPGAKYCNECGSPLHPAQPEPTVWNPGDTHLPALESLVRAQLDEPSRRWRRHLVGGLVAVAALALPAGGYLYYRSGPSPDSLVEVQPDRRPGAPPAPIAGLSQSTDGPAVPRIDAGASEPPPAAAPAAVTEARCPAGVEAMALCGWVARAERGESAGEGLFQVARGGAEARAARERLRLQPADPQRARRVRDAARAVTEAATHPTATAAPKTHR